MASLYLVTIRNYFRFTDLIPQLATIIRLLLYMELGTSISHAIFSLGRNNIRAHWVQVPFVLESYLWFHALSTGAWNWTLPSNSLPLTIFQFAPYCLDHLPLVCFWPPGSTCFKYHWPLLCVSLMVTTTP